MFFEPCPWCIEIETDSLMAEAMRIVTQDISG